MILCLETATSICSVALCDATGVVALRESSDSRTHASQLTVFINDVLNQAQINPSGLQAIAVSKGPGSYTGLRIGVSAAKGISFGTGVPLIGIETTHSMFWGFMAMGNVNDGRLYCPMLDARRMEVYYTIYDSKGNIVKETSAEVMNADSFSSFPSDQEIVLFGEGSAKLKNIIKRNNIIFDDEFRISASHLCIPAGKALKDKLFEDIAYFEPLYLKDFLATKQKKNILD